MVSFIVIVLMLVCCSTYVMSFAAVQSVWGACRSLQSENAKCMCDSRNYASLLPFAMLADTSLVNSWTGEQRCPTNGEMDFLHGAPGVNLTSTSQQPSFLSFVSWLYLYGEQQGLDELMVGARWMALDPATDGVSLWPAGAGGIEGKGFGPNALYDEILPMAVGLDAWLYWNNSCNYNQIVGRVLSAETLMHLYNATVFARASGADFQRTANFSTMSSCISSWETIGLSTWMSSFVAPTSAVDGLQHFAKNVRFNEGGSVEGAVKLYTQCVDCARQIHSLWFTTISTSPKSVDPLMRVLQAQRATLTLLEKLMRAGKCGAPSY
jgi:hypothetical protein